MVLSRVHKRFVRWITEGGTSQRSVATELGASPAFVSDLCTGKKWPGRALANVIERLSTKWESGPIRSEEWDEAERAIARSKSSAA